MFKHKWGYHYAGIVAEVGGDSISLENYNRGTPLQWALDDMFQQKVAAVAEFRRELEALARADKRSRASRSNGTSGSRS